MKRLIIVFGLLFGTCPLFASLDSLGSYKNFVIKKEMWVCTSIAFPVDISYDVFNVDYKTVAQSGQGYFMQVKPGKYKDGDTEIAVEDIILNPSKGVLNVVGKPAGVYEYVFVSTTDDFCGMTNGEKSVVRIYLVPQPVSFPVLTNVCPGSKEQINFNDFIPPEIKYFIDEVGWTIDYTLDGMAVTMPVEAGLAKVGDNVYRYSINDNDGKFKGKYSAMREAAVYSCPEDSAYLTHTVRIRDNEEYVIPNKSISFCTEVLQLVPETAEKLNTNLFGYLGSSAPGGVWSIAYKGPLTETDIPIEENGDVSVPITMVDFLGIDSIVFKYSYEDCMANDTFTLLTFNFNKETFKNVFVEHEQDVCRNLMSGVVELSSIFGFTVPLTSGIWYRQVEGEFEEMLYGAVDISEMKVGSLYTFRYDVNSAVDALCEIQGTSTEFHLRMHDLEVANAEIKICKTQFAQGVTVDLSRYVPGLNDPDRISPDRITWKDNNGSDIANPDRHTLKATEDWQTIDTSTYKMKYQYEVRSDCGLYTGNLYISTIDTIGSDTLRKIVICYTDDYAQHVDLFQILGIAGADGANGKFIKMDYPSGKDENIMKAIEDTGIMNAYELFDTTKESETYTFRYLPVGNGSCVSDNMEITIIVTKNVENDSEFEK
ncbi:MAG: hypothetical protein LBS43_02215 [Prevotellaceae bacterium]|jgi:hypothetical protein|nr:hypothetical protein [Prevotellaceae bacterium]